MDAATCMEGNRNQLKELQTLRVVFLCFIVIMLEGFDIQAAGVAAPRLVPDFGLKPSQIGAFFSASALGSLLFTAIGGLLSDRFGYKPVIIASTLTFGLFCFLTPYAPSFEALVALRFLTGAGLGASLPPILALVSDHSPASQKRRWIGVTYSAISLGGMAAAGILAAGLVAGWKQALLYRRRSTGGGRARDGVLAAQLKAGSVPGAPRPQGWLERYSGLWQGSHHFGDVAGSVSDVRHHVPARHVAALAHEGERYRGWRRVHHPDAL